MTTLLPDTLVRFRTELEDAIGREQAARSRQRRRRLVVLVAAALVLVVGTAAAFGTVRDLFFGPGQSASGPAWSPDGHRIAFWSTRRPAGPSELYVMNVDGSGLRSLTQEWGFEVSPIWSPDWRKIAFLTNPCSGAEGACVGATTIHVMNADGSGKRKLTRGGSTRTIWGGQRVGGGDGLAWSPDGRRIAFLSDRDGPFDIYVVNVDGKGLRRLTQTRESEGAPVWSPDGRRLAFGPDIRVMNAEGGGLRLVAHGTGPAWSPDGRRIAFRSLRDGNGEVYVVDVDGGGLRRLTHSRGSDGGPVWSPDGRKILFVSNRGDHYGDVYVMDADGSGKRNLSRNPASDNFPVWSPDGRRIAFASKRSGSWQVYVMNADGSGLERLTRGKGGD